MIIFRYQFLSNQGNSVQSFKELLPLINEKFNPRLTDSENLDEM